MDAIESRIIQFVAESPSKVGFCDLKRQFCDSHLSIKTLKKIVAKQVVAGRLCYTSQFGRSFIETSYAQPIHISEHVVLKPPLCTYAAAPDEFVVTLEKGASFGGGEHPTTRMVVDLIDAALYRIHRQEKTGMLKAIDIGTGTGILSIVAAKMGVDTIYAIDSDPCAVFEARQNVRSNNLQTRIIVTENDINAVEIKCDFIFANLRTPTLIGLREILLKKIVPGGLLFFSGMKVEEMPVVCDAYRKVGFFRMQKRTEMGWSAVSLARGSLLNGSWSSIADY